MAKVEDELGRRGGGEEGGKRDEEGRVEWCRFCESGGRILAEPELSPDSPELAMVADEVGSRPESLERAERSGWEADRSVV